jgi:hypothetical protein
MAATEYVYINTSQYLPEERYALTGLRQIAAGLKDNAPDELNEFIGSYISDYNSDAADLSINTITGYLLQSFKVANDEDESLETLNTDFEESLAPVVNSKLSNISYNIPSQTMYQDFDGFNFSDNCDCDNYCDYALNIYDNCYTECMCGGGYEPEGGWTLAESTIGQIFSGIGSAIQTIGNEVGWDNIWGSFFNTDDDGSSEDAPVDVNITIEDEPTDWGKIALYSGLVVVIALGGFYAYKKIKN